MYGRLNLPFLGTLQSHAALAGTHRRMGGVIDTSQYTIGNHNDDHHLQSRFNHHLPSSQ